MSCGWLSHVEGVGLVYFSTCISSRVAKKINIIMLESGGVGGDLGVRAGGFHERERVRGRVVEGGF